MSTSLFNLVLNEVLHEVRCIWDRRGYGTAIGSIVPDRSRLSHVAFADDCTLVAHSWLSLKRTALQCWEGLRKRGLTLHPSKCQVQTNMADWDLRGKVALGADFCITLRKDHLSPSWAQLWLCKTSHHVKPDTELLPDGDFSEQ